MSRLDAEPAEDVKPRIQWGGTALHDFAGGPSSTNSIAASSVDSAMRTSRSWRIVSSAIGLGGAVLHGLRVLLMLG